MKAILMTLSVILTSCAEPHSPAEEAILAEVIRQRPDLESVHLTQMDVVATVTLGEELSYRERLLSMKLNNENDFAAKYRAAGKRKNAARHDAASAQTESVLHWIQSYRTEHRETLSTTLYHVVTFSVESRGKGGVRFTADKLAVLYPDGRVWAFFDRGTNVRAGTGVLIPGYEKALGREDKEENKENNK